MPIYEYEIIPSDEKTQPAGRFEIRQSMADAPLTRHPETGEPVRRVYAAFSVGTGGSSNSSKASASYHSSSCGCCGGGSCPL